ncbi:MAG: hypothetical protein D3923_01240 [Candidatus Electrothrix sp. AR3]|nr:hypothetical protein [Candidatus Electrothrix sp. AR3]
MPKFLPLDPEAQLYYQNILTAEQFTEIFFKRIIECNKLALQHKRPLLIREHSHSYFFSPHKKDSTVEDNISWINSTYQKIQGETLPCLLSIRDPIDSWLSLRHNFPQESTKDFDTYCKNYLLFLDMAEKTKNIYVFKYEEIVREPKKTLIVLGDKIGIKLQDNIDISKSYSVVSSGNSGRQGTQLIARPRRPFTEHLVKSAEHSRHYNELCRKLGYPLLAEYIDNKVKMNILKNNFKNTICQHLKKIYPHNFSTIRD